MSSGLHLLRAGESSSNGWLLAQPTSADTQHVSVCRQDGFRDNKSDSQTYLWRRILEHEPELTQGTFALPDWTCVRRGCSNNTEHHRDSWHQLTRLSAGMVEFARSNPQRSLCPSVHTVNGWAVGGRGELRACNVSMVPA